GSPAKHLIVERDRADDAAQAPGLCGLEAQQPDDIDRVGMEGLLVRRLVDARGRIVDAAAEVLHVTEDMALAVLRHRLAEIRADAEVGRGRLLDRIALDRNAAEDDEAATAQQDIVADARET